jgi:hypothetical protein
MLTVCGLFLAVPIASLVICSPKCEELEYSKVNGANISKHLEKTSFDVNNIKIQDLT